MYGKKKPCKHQEMEGKTQRKKTHVWKKTHVNIKKWKEARMGGAQIMLKRMHGLQKVD